MIRDATAQFDAKEYTAFNRIDAGRARCVACVQSSKHPNF